MSTPIQTPATPTHETATGTSDSSDGMVNGKKGAHQDQDKDQRDVDMLQRYLRLVSQVTSRLTPELYPVDLGEAILQVWNQLCTIIPGANIHNGGGDADAPIRLLSVHMDVCASLEVFLLADPVRANVASVLPIIWNRFLHSCKAEAAAELIIALAVVVVCMAAHPSGSACCHYYCCCCVCYNS